MQSEDFHFRFLFFDKQMRVELWTPKGSQYELKCKGSPGNTEQFEDMLPADHTHQAAVVLAVCIQTASADQSSQKTHKSKAYSQLRVGAAFVDQRMRTIKLCEFPDSESLSTFEVHSFGCFGASQFFSSHYWCKLV